MPRRTGLSGPPADFVADGGTWPKGPFLTDAPSAVLVAAHISSALADQIRQTGQTMTEVAAGLNVARSTVYDIVNGTSFPDIHTISNAQAHFGVQLWPEYVRTRREAAS